MCVLAEAILGESTSIERSEITRRSEAMIALVACASAPWPARIASLYFSVLTRAVVQVENASGSDSAKTLQRGLRIYSQPECGPRWAYGEVPRCRQATRPRTMKATTSDTSRLGGSSDSEVSTCHSGRLVRTTETAMADSETAIMPLSVTP